MSAITLNALHRALLAEADAGQITYVLIGGGFVVGGANAAQECVAAIHDLIYAGLLRREMTYVGAEVPVKLTDTGEEAVW